MVLWARDCAWDCGNWAAKKISPADMGNKKADQGLLFCFHARLIYSKWQT